MEYFEYFYNAEIWQWPGQIKDGTSINVIIAPCFILWLTSVITLSKATDLNEFAILGITSNPLTLAYYTIFVCAPGPMISIAALFLAITLLIKMIRTTKP